MSGLARMAAPIMESAPGPEVLIDGVRYLYFGGTSYLGLAARGEVIEAGCRAMRQFGVHSATSRAGFGTTPPVLEVERRAAEFFGTEDAFYFASGYVSSHIMVRALAAVSSTLPGAQASACPPDAVLLEQSAHFSAQEAVRLLDLPVITFRAGDPSDLARAGTGHRRVLALADAVAPATGRFAPVREFLGVLAQHERAILLLDDAHGFGVLGPNGRGLLDELGLWARVNQCTCDDNPVRLAVCGTLAKALGGFGGIIPGSRAFVDHARAASHYYEGASAPPVAAAGASAKALEIATNDPSLRQRLRANVLRLRDGLRRLGCDLPDGAAAQVGVTLGTASDMRRVHAALKARGILVPYLPAYSGLPPEGVLRCAVFADHTADQVDRLLVELAAVLGSI